MASHEEIMEEIKAMREEVQPLVSIAPDLKSMAELYNAGRVGGVALKWVAVLTASIAAIWVALKALAGTLMRAAT